MADELSTMMVRAALGAPAVDEYVSALSYLLLVQTKLSGHSVLSELEFQAFVAEILRADSLNAMQAGDRLLRQRIKSLPQSALVEVGMVQTGLRLAAGALSDSGEMMRATYQMVRPESPKSLWWLTHAGCLGMCYWAARMGADGEVPATEVLEYVDQYTGFLFQASGHPALDRVQDVVEVFELASSAIYGAVEPRPGRTSRSQPSLENVPSPETVQGWRDADSPARIGSRVEEMAELVDSLTDGQWRFRQAVRELDGLWTNLYSCP
jgi:hypothetical protein